MRIQAVRAPFYSPPSSLPGPSPSRDGRFSEGLSGGRVRCGSTYKDDGALSPFTLHISPFVRGSFAVLHRSRPPAHPRGFGGSGRQIGGKLGWGRARGG